MSTDTYRLLPGTSLTEWRQRWPLVLAASIGFSFLSLMTPATGLFMEPLSREFGWSRTQLSSGLAISAGISLVMSPFVGTMVDRWGSRKLALPGLVVTAAAIAAFSLVNGSSAQWIILWCLWGLASLAVQSTVWSAAVASVFTAGRGLAMGLTLSGTALAQVIVPPLTNWLIDHQGWRAAYFWLGTGWGSVALLLSIFFLFDAHDGARKKEPGARSQAFLSGLSRQQAWRSSSLWRVALSTFLILTITIAVTVHQFPILVEAGLDRTDAAWLASLVGVAAVFGKLITGGLLDRYHARWVGGLTLASTAIAYPLLLEPIRTPSLIVVGIMISGYASGTKIQLCGYLTARYAGMRNFGAIFGVMTSMVALASGVGTVLAGMAHDHYGSYTPLLITGTIVSLISGALVWSLGDYPDWREA